MKLIFWVIEMKLFKCEKCTHEYGTGQIRKCPHPSVQKNYGEYICVYCCKKCKFSKAYGTGWICNYKGA